MITFSKKRAPLDILYCGEKVGQINRVKWSNLGGSKPSYELTLRCGNKLFHKLNDAKLFVQEFYINGQNITSL